MRNILLKCKSYFFYNGIFSFVINALLLTPVVFMINALDRVLSSRSLETLSMLMILAIFALIISAFLENIKDRLMGRFSYVLNKMLGYPILKTILEKKEIDNKSRQGMEDVNLLQGFITTKGANALFDIPWIPIYLFILYLFHPYLLYLALIAVIILIILAFWEYKTTHFNQLEIGAYNIGARTMLDRAIENNEIINVLNMQDRIAYRWWELNSEYLNKTQNVQNKTSSIKAITNWVQSLLYILGISTGAYLVLNYDATPGIMIGAIIIIGKAIAPIKTVINAGQSFIDAKEAYKRLDILLQQQYRADDKLSLPAPKGNINVQNLYFFLNQDRNILGDINFSIAAGECLGVIGASASGKSTLARLLVGYYKPGDGFVRLDGADVSQWSRNGLGHYIGYLPQDIQLFNGTVAENIARLDKVKKHEKQIIEAAKKIGIHEMILTFPQGYDTNIGDNGNKLSGGQKQRIGLARAIFSNPNYLVLDEPNANLDGEAEIALIDLINELKHHQVTVVLISHKPNLIQVTDKLLALHNGNQMKFGPTDKVLKSIQIV